MKLKSQISTSSNSFKKNINKHLKDIENIEQIARNNSLGGPEKSTGTTNRALGIGKRRHAQWIVLQGLGQHVARRH